MTGLMEVATGEIWRTGNWSLRALGLRFGSAERVAAMLVSTECVVGGALSTLRRNEEAMKNGSGRPIARQQFGMDFWKLEGEGRTLLETGPVALDLLTYAVRRFGFGRVDLTGCLDPLFAVALAECAVRRNVGLLILFKETIQTQKAGRLGWLAAAPGEGAAVYLGGAEGLPPAALLESLGDQVAAATKAWSADPARKSTGCVMLGFRSSRPLPAEISVAHAIDVDGRIKAGQRGGVMVEREDLDELYRMQRETWAPTSDRSRGQALF